MAREAGESTGVLHGRDYSSNGSPCRGAKATGPGRFFSAVEPPDETISR
jgi:hypothetical protein